MPRSWLNVLSSIFDDPACGDGMAKKHIDYGRVSDRLENERTAPACVFVQLAFEAHPQIGRFVQTFAVELTAELLRGTWLEFAPLVFPDSNINYRQEFVLRNIQFPFSETLLEGPVVTIKATPDDLICANFSLQTFVGIAVVPVEVRLLPVDLAVEEGELGTVPTP